MSLRATPFGQLADEELGCISALIAAPASGLRSIDVAGRSVTNILRDARVVTRQARETSRLSRPSWPCQRKPTCGATERRIWIEARDVAPSDDRSGSALALVAQAATAATAPMVHLEERLDSMASVCPVVSEAVC